MLSNYFATGTASSEDAADCSLTHAAFREADDFEMDSTNFQSADDLQSDDIGRHFRTVCR